MNRLKNTDSSFQLPAGFDTHRYNPVPVTHPLVTPPLVVPWHTAISQTQAQMCQVPDHSRPTAPICSGLAAIFVNSFYVNLCTKSPASL